MERTNVRIENQCRRSYAADMNSPKAGFGDKVQARDSQAHTSRKVWASLALLGALWVLSGCAHLEQYSIDSWDGPMPMADLRNLQAGP